MSGLPAISNSGCYTEKILAFLEFCIKPLTQKVKSYVKAINDFLKKIASILHFPDDIALYAIHVVDLYLNIPHDEA